MSRIGAFAVRDAVSTTARFHSRDTRPVPIATTGSYRRDLAAAWRW
nr:hypothetical protein [Mycolicibacterium elephantis]